MVKKRLLTRQFALFLVNCIHTAIQSAKQHELFGFTVERKTRVNRFMDFCEHHNWNKTTNENDVPKREKHTLQKMKNITFSCEKFQIWRHSDSFSFLFLSLSKTKAKTKRRKLHTKNDWKTTVWCVEHLNLWDFMIKTRCSTENRFSQFCCSLCISHFFFLSLWFIRCDCVSSQMLCYNSDFRCDESLIHIHLLFAPLKVNSVVDVVASSFSY